MSLNPTSSADSSSCVATAMWRSTPARSSSSCSERLRPTERGMKIRGKTTVDLSGSTGRREGTAPSTFKAGTSLTSRLSPAVPGREPGKQSPSPCRGKGRERRNRKSALNLHQLSQSLTAVILAAGHGTRMRSRIPKVLHPICGRPMLDYVLDAVAEAGAKDVKVIVNPHHAEVAAHLDERGIAPTFQREPKGTAHALKQIPEGELKGKEVLVVNGDSPLLTGTTIKKVLDAHRVGKTPATIASVDDPTRNDGRIIRAADGSLEKIVERKDATEEIQRTVHEFNVGLYVFEGTPLLRALDKVGDDNKAGEFYLTDVFMHLSPVTIVKLDDAREA